MIVRAVAFDLGETLVDETRYWGEWADRLGVPHLTLFALLGASIARGEDHRSLLEKFGASNVEEADAPVFSADDLYPDVRPTLSALQARGILTVIAGNFSGRIAGAVRSWGLPVEAVFSASDIGSEKPNAEFFTGLASRLKLRPPELLYVGDRVDNDVEAALAAGCCSAHLRRGPWAFVQEERAAVHDAVEARTLQQVISSTGLG